MLVVRITTAALMFFGQLLLSVHLSPSISPATIAQPSVAKLLRLGMACFINATLSSVFVNSTSSYNSTSGVVTVVQLGSNDPANLATGNCSLLAASPRRLLAITEQLAAVSASRDLALSSYSQVHDIS